VVAIAFFSVTTAFLVLVDFSVLVEVRFPSLDRALLAAVLTSCVALLRFFPCPSSTCLPTQIESVLFCLHELLLCSSLILLRCSHKHMARPYKLPCGLLVPILPLTVASANIAICHTEYILMGLGTALFGALLYAVWHWRQSRRFGSVRQHMAATLAAADAEDAERERRNQQRGSGSGGNGSGGEQQQQAKTQSEHGSVDSQPIPEEVDGTLR
jgi:hypothetical protein